MGGGGPMSTAVGNMEITPTGLGNGWRGAYMSTAVGNMEITPAGLGNGWRGAYVHSRG